MTILASAPGKLVISGEYAVLVGAPALVLAVDRRMTCALREALHEALHERAPVGWHFNSHGYATDTHHPLATLLADTPLPRDDPAYLCQHVLRQLRIAGIGLDALPEQLSIDTDSRAGFDAGHKLGLGTSAAVCATLTGALLERCDSPTPSRSPVLLASDVFPLALAAHRAAQSGRGSGVDVAAACHGGLIRYSIAPEPHIARLPFPAGVAFAAIWTGASADTRSHIASFDAWRRGSIPAALAQLIGAAAQVVGSVPDAREFVRQLRAYAITLQALDASAGLGIYSTAHRTLTDLAHKLGIVYKPCGAGGGDLGMAFALEPEALAAFERAAYAAGLNRLPLELDEHGITVSVEG